MGKKIVSALVGLIFTAVFVLPYSTLAVTFHQDRPVTETSANPYQVGPKNPITWGGVTSTAVLERRLLEKHNVVVRLTQAGLKEIGDLISDILSGDPSVANLINYLAMGFLDKCTDTKVVADLWDNYADFTYWIDNNYPNQPTKNYYLQNATYACGITTSNPSLFNYGEGTTHCFGNEIYFEYIAGYNPTGTWDQGTNSCKDDGKGLFSMCLPIPLLNDEGAPICVNAIIWGQERDKRVGPAAGNPITYAMGGFYWSPFGKCGRDLPGVCPTSSPWNWDNYYFIDRITGNRLIVDYNRKDLTVRLKGNIGEDWPATATCEGDYTEHTTDDYLDITVELRNFEVALTFSSPYVSSQNLYIDCLSFGPSCNFNASATYFPNSASFCFKNRDVKNDEHICDPQYPGKNTTNYDYDPERVISNYINGRAYIRMPILGLRLGIQIKGNFTDDYDWGKVVRGLGINLKALDLVAGVAYDFVPMSSSATTPACRNPNWNQVGTAQYCPEYRVSQKFAKTLLWLDAVLRLMALDYFRTDCIPNHTVTQYDTCIAYFLFPGQVFDLKDIIKSLSPVDHPTEEVIYVGAPDYYTHKPNKIFFDFGFTNDFWADSAGIILAMNVGVDIRYVLWNSPATSITQVKLQNFNDYVSTCVQGNFAALQAATSPINLIRECVPQTTCPAPVRTVSQCTGALNNNSGVYPHVFSSEVLPQYPSAPTLAEGRYGYSLTSYYVGIAVHHNLISRILYEAIGDGLACVWVDKYTPMLGGFAGGFLKTDSFAFFMPKLKDAFPGKDMAVEIIPNYRDPGNPSGNTGGAASYNKPLSVVAYAKTGGPTFRPVNNVYMTGSTRVNFWSEFVSNATFGSSFTMFPSPSTWFDTADLTIDLPYIDLSFNVITTGDINSPSRNWMRVFGLTVGIRLSVDVDIVPCVSPDCGLTVKFPPYDSTNFTQPLTSIYKDYYTGQAYNKDNAYFPQGGTFARVIDLTLYADPDVRYFIAYNSNALGLSGSQWSEILGNVLPVVLNGLAGAKLRVALDPTALIQIPIELNFPWVGPEFGTGVQNWDTPFVGNPADGVGDYFEMFIHWRGRPTLTNIIKLLKNFGVDIVDTISGVMGGAPQVPVQVRLADYEVNGNGYKVTPPETFIVYTSDPHALFTKIKFAGWSANSSSGLKYSWRLDGGTWSLWQSSDEVVLTHLLEGYHMFEVRSRDENKFIDPTPARYIFRVDSVGPDIRLQAPEVVKGNSVRVFADIRDAQAPQDVVLVSYRIDGGEWSGWKSASEITAIDLKGLTKGEHILEVRAKDDVGNISTYKHRFFVTEKVGVFGCSSSSAAGIPSLGLMILLFGFVSAILKSRKR